MCTEVRKNSQLPIDGKNLFSTNLRVPLEVVTRSDKIFAMKEGEGKKNIE